MTPKTIRNVIAWFLLISVSQATAQTLQVQLRRQPVRPRQVVRLGHIAELAGLPKAKLRELQMLDICPAPGIGDRLIIEQDEIRRLLVLSGIDGRSIAFSGPRRVELSGRSGPAVPVRADKTVAQRVERAIAGYWKDRYGVSAANHVKLLQADLPDFLQSHRIIDVTAAGQAASRNPDRPGRREFRVVFADESTDQPIAVTVSAEVHPVFHVVVANRNLNPGEVIQAADVRIAEYPALPTGGRGQASGSWINVPKEVIGLEVSKPMMAGRPIDRHAVRPPLVIRRRDGVVVVARAGGFTVRTLATAKEDARVGALVQLENPETKETFTARAVGPKFAEVVLQAPSSGPANSPGGSP